ncbi:MAG: ABC transporter substrate-binding protein [Burkholderiales bacterium]|nr:ABC transporter substrate-binding protein [Burkholderiales bacterium]
MSSFNRREFLAAGAALGAAGAIDPSLVHAQGTGTLRVAMTAADVPLPNGQTDQGAEGMRFVGYTLFDSLVEWDLSSSSKPSGLVPGLASSWQVDSANPTRWIFRIREGVRFHDGSPFDASVAVWNLEKILKEDAPQFDRRQAAQGRSRIPTVRSYRAIDPMTLEVITSIPDALLPFGIAWIVMSSRARWEEAGRNWDAFVRNPSGTGPWRFARYQPRERLELTRNAEYWNKARVPKAERLVLIPMPEGNTRVAALRGGQVDWIEAPPPDTVDSLRKAGMQIVTNVYPHNWPWHFSRVEGSPWNDARVRRAANLAIDREGMKSLLGGLMVPAKGMVPPTSQWFGKPTFDVKFDRAAALKLMAEAGHSPARPLSVKAIISPSGSGQMQPLPMNELIQQNLAAIGIKVDFEVMEWNALLASWRAGAKDPSSRGAHSTNSSYFSQDPFTALIRHLDSNLVPPSGTNWGYYQDAELDKLFAAIRNTFDPRAQEAAVQRAHEKIVNDALFLFVAHDVNPRALSPRVKGFVQAQNWFQDLTPVVVG